MGVQPRVSENCFFGSFGFCLVFPMFLMFLLGLCFLSFSDLLIVFNVFRGFLYIFSTVCVCFPVQWTLRQLSQTHSMNAGHSGKFIAHRWK